MIEVSTERLVSNVAVLRETVGPGCELLGVIKAEAYGHGACLCAPVLAAAGVRWLGVGDAEEGRRVREALRADDEEKRRPEKTHLLVMCGFEASEATEIVAAQLTPVIWTVEHIEALERAAARLPRDASSDRQPRVAVHLEIDSGMARQGVVPGRGLEAVLQRLRNSSSVWCEGVLSHLHSSEIAGCGDTARQCERFAAALRQVRASGVQPRFVHLGNTSAVDEASTLDWVRTEAAALGSRAMVRPGLALYGYALPLECADAEAGHLARRLQPVACWMANIIGLREVGAGETVGYGSTFVAERPTQLALLPVGYADGFRREASSGVGDGWVVIAGRRAPVVGRVSMNLTVVDVSQHVAGGQAVSVGEAAVLLGQGVTAADHAGWAGTIPYEILCGMRGHRRLLAPWNGTLA